MKVNSKSGKSKGNPGGLSLNLPRYYPWQVLQKLSLDLTEYLSEDESKKLDQIVRNRNLDGYLELAEEWGLQCIDPIGTSTAKIRVKYLLASIIKKFQFDTDKEMRIARAKEKFFLAESNCKTYNHSGYKDLLEPQTDWGVKILHYARMFMVKLLGPELPGHKALLDRSRHGPGATIGTCKGNTSLYHKYSEFPYSCTIDAFRYARFAIETDQRWFGALQNAYRARFGIQKHLPLDMKLFWTRVINVENANRIDFVPKDARTERTIAIEPSLNVYLQLGVDGFIRRRLKRFGVDLDSQEKNQELARLGSLPGGKQFVTVDLSAASDSISTKLCELLLPSQWFSYLMDLRCPSGSLEGESVSYEKISSMGNGFTFALESAIFAAFVYAVIKAGGGHFSHKHFAVFGDDLVVERRWYYQLVEALRLAGFSINLEKTFSYGPIRESCGTDWFQGTPIRPVFLTKMPTKVMDVLCDYNRVKRLLSLRFGIEESDTLSYIRKFLPESVQLLIGPLSDEEFDSYLHAEQPRKGMFKRWVYKYKRLIVKPKRGKGKDFHMRKLMHDLRGKPEPQKWEVERTNYVLRWLNGGGSRFTVTSRNALSVGYKYSVASEWQSVYNEYYPPHVF